MQMNAYSLLFHALDKDPGNAGALEEYLSGVPREEAAWAVYFLARKRFRRTANPNGLKKAVSAATGLPLWLVEESHGRVGNLAEAMALLAQEKVRNEGGMSLLGWTTSVFPRLSEGDWKWQAMLLQEVWKDLHPMEILPFHHLLSGHAGVSVESGLLPKVLAGIGGLHPAIVAHRLAKDWHPEREGLQGILEPVRRQEAGLVPKPFVRSIQERPGKEEFRRWQDWEIYWNPGGERAQILKSGGEVLVWSVHQRMANPVGRKLIEAAARLPDGACLEGNILAGQDFLAYHIHSPEDLNLPEIPMIQPAERVPAASWEEVASLHRKGSVPGKTGFLCKRGMEGFWMDFSPMEAYLALVGARPGNNGRLDIYSLAAKDGDSLAVVIQLGGDLTGGERAIIDRHIQEKAAGKFGPLRAVEPGLVFKVAFKGVDTASRRKSGISLVACKLVALETSKVLHDVVGLEELKGHLNGKGDARPEQDEFKF